MTRIDGNGGLGGLERLVGTGADRARGAGAGEASGGRFSDILKASIEQVSQMQVDADEAIEALSTGRTDNVAEVMTAVQKAELAFDTLLQIRNKLLDAYNEVRQMPL